MARWISVKRQVLVLECVVVGVVQLVEQVGGGGCRGDGRPHRHRVDQQAHHRFRAGHVGWPARDRDAEGDIVVAGQPAQQLRAGALQHGIDGGVVRARQFAKGPRGLVRQPNRFNASPPQPQPARRADQGRGVKAGEHLAPRRVGGIKVPTGQPGNKFAIRRGRGQPLPVIAGNNFPQQDRQRPAIRHDVVIGEHKPVPVSAVRINATRKAGWPSRSQTAARSAAHIRWICSSTSGSPASSSTYRQGTTGSAGMICTGSSNWLLNRAARFGCRFTTVCTASRRRCGSSGPVTVISSCTAYTSSPLPCAVLA